MKKNEIRLNTFQEILKSDDQNLRMQFIKSGAIEMICRDFICDFREFNVSFHKIDLEFLAFRKMHPLRLEAISFINTVFMHKNQASLVYKEFIMYIRRHFVIRNEVALLKQMRGSSQEITSLLFFSIILESQEDDLIYVMRQEDAHTTISELIKDKPNLIKRFPTLAKFNLR